MAEEWGFNVGKQKRRKEMGMDRTYVIGVAGGTASGKTTIVQIIKNYFGEGIELIGHDCYYKAHDNMPFEEREKLNYDHPWSFDTERMIEDVIALKSGKVIERPVYDYSDHNRAKETVTVYPKKILMLEAHSHIGVGSTAQSDGSENIRRYGCGRAADAENYKGYGRAWQECGVRSPAISQRL